MTKENLNLLMSALARTVSTVTEDYKAKIPSTEGSRIFVCFTDLRISATPTAVIQAAVYAAKCVEQNIPVKGTESGRLVEWVNIPDKDTNPFEEIGYFQLHVFHV